MGRVMGCGLCPYNAIEKVGNYENEAFCRVEQHSSFLQSAPRGRIILYVGVALPFMRMYAVHP